MTPPGSDRLAPVLAAATLALMPALSARAADYDGIDYENTIDILDIGGVLICGAYEGDGIQYDDTRTCAADAGATYRLDTFGFATKLSYRSDPVDDNLEVDAALLYRLGPSHELAFGSVEPAIDRFVPGTHVLSNPALVDQQLNRLAYSAVTEARMRDDSPFLPGILLTGAGGGLSYGVSLHQLPDTDDPVATAAVSYRYDPVAYTLRVAAGVEYGEAYDGPAYRATADLQVGDFSVAADVFQREEFGQSVTGAYLKGTYRLLRTADISAGTFVKYFEEVQTEDLVTVEVTLNPDGPQIRRILPGYPSRISPFITLGLVDDRLNDQTLTSFAFGASF